MKPSFLNRSIIALFTLASCALLSACDGAQNFSTANGELPNEALPFVSKYLGTYSATPNALFSSKAGNVEILLDQTTLRIVTDFDIVYDRPSSRQGVVSSVTAFINAKNEIDSFDAIFSLDGKDVTFHFTHDLFGKEVMVLDYEKYPPGYVGGVTRPAETVGWDLTRE